MEKKKKETLPVLNPVHKEALARIAASPDYKALEALFRIEENNIIISSFKNNSSDVDLRIKKAWHEGRVYELRKILKSFAEAKKEEDE